MKLGELCNVVTKGTTPTSIGLSFEETGIPFLRITNLGKNTVSLDDVLYISPETHKVLSRSIVKPNDFLITIAGTIGKVAIVPTDFPESNCNQAIAILRFNNEKLWLNYLLHWLSTSDAVGQITGKKVTATISNLSLGQIKELEIPLPPLPEQKRIAAILDKADSLRRKKQEAIQLADKFLRAVFLDMFGDPVTNPKMWNKRTLQELTLLITDGKHGDCIDEENSGYYFISAKDIHDEIIDYSSARQIRKKDFEEVHRRTDLSGDDLVMVNTGATIGKIAIATNSDNTGKTTFQKSVAVIKPNKTLISTIFLKYVFLLRINIFASKGAGSAIKNLLLSEMRRFEIIVPDIKLQNEFAKKVDIVDRMKIQTRLSQQKSDVLFNALSQKAFAGKL